MAFELGGRKIDAIGVIGSGQIGPDIALHVLEARALRGVAVTVVDVSEQALTQGRARIERKLKKKLEKGRISPEAVEATLARVRFTSDYDAVADADLVIEAATEDLAVKRKIFAQLEKTCSSEAILASNSSHLPPEQIFAELATAARTAITHYFFPAEKNPLVEIVRGEATSDEVYSFLLRFYEQSGKLAVAARSRFGYAIDPVFEGLFFAGCLAVERDMATVEQVDAVCQRALGQGVGPFTAMNLTGGNALTRVGLAGYHEAIMPWFRVPQLLERQLERGQPWPTPGRDQQVEVDDATHARVAAWMRGAYFMLVGELLDAGIMAPSDLEEGVALGLAMKPPLSLMNQLGLGESLALVQRFVADNDGARVPASLQRQAEEGRPWPIEHVHREDHGDVAVLTIRRFKVLNALDERVLAQLDEHIARITADDSVRAVVVRGYGVRAFVSGADIRELSQLQRPEDAVQQARAGQEVLSRIEKLGKPVIAAMNGLAFGGGNELAMACHARLAAAGQRVFVGQPEPKLGVIPGYGGTQRLPRLIGLSAAWPLLRTGEPISSQRAVELGLVRAEVAAARLLDEAIALARRAASGEEVLAPIPSGPIEVPDDLPEVDIGHLSRAIDELVQRAALDGARTTLDEGMRIEAETFGRCLEREDFKIGMTNFIENGPRAKAAFVHR